jgi:hypothetical protein
MMIMEKVKTDLSTYRSYGDTANLEVKILASIAGEMENQARKVGGAKISDGDANIIIKRHLRHAGITLQMNAGDPTANLVVKLLGKYHVDDVMGDEEMRERILSSQLGSPKEVLKHLNAFGPAVDMGRAKMMVRTLFGQ